MPNINYVTRAARGAFIENDNLQTLQSLIVLSPTANVARGIKIPSCCFRHPRRK